MIKEEFIKHHNEQYDKFCSIVHTVDDDLEIDFRDSSEIEIHGFEDQSKEQTLIDRLSEGGFEIEDDYDYRYEETFRINLVVQNFGSYGLEDYSDEEFKDFVELYELDIS